MPGIFVAFVNVALSALTFVPLGLSQTPSEEGTSAKTAREILQKAYARYDNSKTVHAEFEVILRSFPCPDDTYEVTAVDWQNRSGGRTFRSSIKTWRKHTEGDLVSLDWYTQAAREANLSKPTTHVVTGKQGDLSINHEGKSYLATTSTKAARFSKDFFQWYVDRILGSGDNRQLEFGDSYKYRNGWRITCQVKGAGDKLLSGYVDIEIDKRTYAIQRIEGRNQAEHVLVIARNQKFDKPLPESAFRFTALKKYKRIDAMADSSTPRITP
jgi:hypothetical protein